MTRCFRRRKWDGAKTGFVADGLSRTPWSGAAPIRQIFRAAFATAGLPYANPHSFRKTLALHGDTLNLTREEEKAYSQNFGHESVWTTRESYGTLPRIGRRKSCGVGEAALRLARKG